MTQNSEKQAFEPFTVEHFEEWAKGLELDSGEPWLIEPFQRDFVRDVFTGVPVCWLIVPEGNGKTTLIAGLALYFCEFQRGASIVVAAASREQAETLYMQAAGFVIRSPQLHRQVLDKNREIRGKRAMDVPRFICQDGHRRINYYEGGRIQIRAADDRTGDGIIPTLCVIDELHRHRDLKLYNTWRGKLKKRAGQMLVISTAGEPGGEFEELRERIRQSAPDVRRETTFIRAAGKSVLLHEWALPEDGDPDDLELVAAANPLASVTAETLREKHDAEDFNPIHWRRFVCNLPTRSEFAAIMEAEWDAAKVSAEIPPGIPIGVGLDVAWKWDTTALVPFWLESDEFRLLGPAIILEPPRDGSTLDPAKVEKAILDLHERNPLHTVVMDTTRAEQLADWIYQTTGATVIDRAQGNALQAEDYERFMEALRNGWLKHTGDSGLRRHVLNAITRVLPGGQARFDREKHSRMSSQQDTRVIDALTAAAMVHSELAGGTRGGILF